jgi:predicted unusual protein kinase regulating ubiquinone biosynthesis (AarF/ABC1/UbiB family)
MPTPEDALARIDSLMQLGLRLALSTATGRIVLAKVGENLDPARMPGALGPSLGAALERAAASRPAPLGLAEVERILTGAWGVKRVEDELDSLEAEPVAVTFTSQVHRGVHAGASVAVKVLRPGVAAALRQDLTLFSVLIAPLSGLLPGLNPAALLTEARERALDECDLEHEAAQMRRWGRALRGSAVVIPVPVSDLCREGVLVSSWLEGRALSDGVSAGPDAIASLLLGFVLGGVREGLLYCDLNAQDVLVLADGRIGVVDFGAVAAVDPARADLALAVIDALVAEDPVALEAGLVGLGLLEPGHGASALAVMSAALGPWLGGEPARLDADAVAAARRRLDGMEAQVLELALAARLTPADLYPARGLMQLVSVLARMGASGVWRDAVPAALAEGWPN